MAICITMENRLSGLDALRGVAALCVTIFHWYLLTHDGEGPGKAYLAVDFFFVLSGYIMARTYESRLRSGDITPVQFLRIRLRRLMPIMMIGSAIGIPVTYKIFPEHFSTIVVFNMMMLPTFVTELCFPLNVPAWSVFAEISANVAHAFSLVRARTKVLLIAILGLGLTLIVVVIKFNDLNVGSLPPTLLASFPRLFFSYIFGIVLWRWWGERPPFVIPWWMTVSLMPTLFFAVYLLDTRSALIDIIFVILLSPLLMAGGMVGKGGPILTALGKMSFPLYAVHYPLIQLFHAAEFPPVSGLVGSLMLARVIVLTGEIAGKRRSKTSLTEVLTRRSEANQ